MKTEEKKSQATKRKMLLKREKGMLGSYLNTVEFQEPILILMRRSQKAEWHENATSGTFKFEHSDGEEREIILNTKYLQTFDYGKKTFKGYICHEDFPTPLPEHPLLTTELVGIAIDKTLNDIKNWKTEEIKAKGDFYWKIFMGIGALILLYIGYKLLFPSHEGGETKAVAEVVNTSITIAKNVSILG